MRWRLPRMKLSACMTCLVIIGLVLGLFVQRRNADRRERALKGRLKESLQGLYAREHMSRLLNDTGIDILKEATSVELLRVSREVLNGGAYDGVGKPTGVFLDNSFALRVACVLLDHRNFGNLNADDVSDPEIGIRIRRDSKTLDLFIGSYGTHQDIWIIIRDENGKVVQNSGSTCIHNDPILPHLTSEALSRLANPKGKSSESSMPCFAN